MNVYLDLHQLHSPWYYGGGGGGGAAAAHDDDDAKTNQDRCSFSLVYEIDTNTM